MQNFSRRHLAVAALTVLTGLQTMQAQAQSQYLGQIMCAPYNFVPVGWAALDGSLMSIAQNTALFSLLGTSFGGDGVSTFALPDMRGRTLVDMGQGPGLTPRNIGETGGQEVTTLSVANLPPHSHTFAPLGSSNDATSISPAGKVAASKARTTLYADPTNIVAMQAGTTGSTGNNVPVNNMQPYLTVNCYIALAGIYPSRY